MLLLWLLANLREVLVRTYDALEDLGGDQDLLYGTVSWDKQHLNLNLSYTNGVNAFQIVGDNQISSSFRAPETTKSQIWEGYKSRGLN